MEKITVTLKDLTEQEAYELYFKVLNVTRTKEMQLTNQMIKIASVLAGKPMDFVLDTQKSTSLKSKRAELANEVGISVQGIYPQLNALVQNKVLMYDEDKFIRFNPQINYLRQTIKKSLESKQPFSFDYVFSLNIPA